MLIPIHQEKIKYQTATQHEALVSEPSTSITLTSSAIATNWGLHFEVVTMQVYDTLTHAAECQLRQDYVKKNLW